MAPVVAAQRLGAVGVLQQVEGRETGQIQLVVKDEGRFDACVGQEQLVAELGQAVPVLGHDRNSGLLCLGETRAGRDLRPGVSPFRAKLTCIGPPAL
jgi:hypothetical protein